MKEKILADLEALLVHADHLTTELKTAIEAEIAKLQAELAPAPTKAPGA